MNALGAARPISCIVLLLLAVASQAALAPLLGGGPAAVDLPLLLVLWFALTDRTPRVIAIAALVVLSRTLLGASTALEAALPVAAALLLVRLGRHIVDPRDPVRRIPLVLAALAAAGLVHRALWALPWRGSIGDGASALLVAAIAASLLYSILDQAAPLVRSPDHPM